MSSLEAIKVQLKIHSIKMTIARCGIDDGGQVQKFIDSEVLRKCSPYVPFLKGDLEKSGKANTVLGSGRVIYKTPYARKQYYMNAGRGNQGMAKGGRRGKKWFERMKADHLMSILDGAAKVAGGKGKK